MISKEKKLGTCYPSLSVALPIPLASGVPLLQDTCYPSLTLIISLPLGPCLFLHRNTCYPSLSLVPRLHSPAFLHPLFYTVREKLGSGTWERGYPSLTLAFISIPLAFDLSLLLASCIWDLPGTYIELSELECAREHKCGRCDVFGA